MLHIIVWQLLDIIMCQNILYLLVYEGKGHNICQVIVYNRA
jgi:hypothetical protein